jgi:carboxylesterase type B
MEYNGTDLVTAARGGLIAVVIQYRLNGFGWCRYVRPSDLHVLIGT